MHIGVIFHQYVGHRFSTFAMKFGALIELIYVINVCNFGVDRSQGWSLVSSQILRVCYYHQDLHPEAGAYFTGNMRVLHTYIIYFVYFLKLLL